MREQIVRMKAAAAVIDGRWRRVWTRTGRAELRAAEASFLDASAELAAETGLPVVEIDEAMINEWAGLTVDEIEVAVRDQMLSRRVELSVTNMLPLLKNYAAVCGALNGEM